MDISVDINKLRSISACVTSALDDLREKVIDKKIKVGILDEVYIVQGVCLGRDGTISLFFEGPEGDVSQTNINRIRFIDD